LNEKQQLISLTVYNSILGSCPDDFQKGIRKNMSLTDVIISYPDLKKHIEKLISERYDSWRHRYYPYLMSVICGKEKYSSDAFYTGLLGRSETDREEFKKWREELKNHIIDNEHLHDFWIL
jgi:hypothetical protein